MLQKNSVHDRRLVSSIIMAKTFIFFIHSDSKIQYYKYRIGNTDENIGIDLSDDFYGIDQGGK